ncbi:MAG: FAD-dependent oxidoreductase, partial [Sedimentisphaerales bacterium]|nr:FAD-dependent oxidoreductase [Sedimentisphaerales bacterium]
MSDRVRLKIDGRTVEVDEGSTVLDAARKLVIDIPTMCFMKGCTPAASCMVCIVKIINSGQMVPACGTKVFEGMEVESETEQVRQMRKAALELLLSDHVGDCFGPCHITCPAKMDIPMMIRQINSGDLRGAVTTVKRDIALPAILGRICPAPCENACRRAKLDQPVSICLLKRFVADVDLQAAEPYVPSRKPPKGKQVAIIGAGPAGLSCAYYLWQKGFQCTVFDDHDRPGGALRYSIDEKMLSREV